MRSSTPGATQRRASTRSSRADANGEVQATPEQMPQKPFRWENFAQFLRKVRVA